MLGRDERLIPVRFDHIGFSWAINIPETSSSVDGNFVRGKADDRTCINDLARCGYGKARMTIFLVHLVYYNVSSSTHGSGHVGPS